MFVPAQELGFNLEALIEETVAAWSEIKQSGLQQPESESYGDFIADELNAQNLRSAESDQATFNATASECQFREAIIAALDRWLLETDRERTIEDDDNYARPLGE